MAMTLGGTGDRKADINVTPLIDVLLVLLIIFMVISPVQSEGFKALVPQLAPPGPDATPQPLDIVITVAANGTLEINQEAVEMSNLAQGIVDRLAPQKDLRDQALLGREVRQLPRHKRFRGSAGVLQRSGIGGGLWVHSNPGR